MAQAGRPARGPSIKAECASLLPEILKAIEGVDSDTGELRVVQMVRCDLTPSPRGFRPRVTHATESVRAVAVACCRWAP